MRKKLVLGTILTLSLLIVTVVVAVSPVIAGPKDNSIDLYGTGARVTFSLPTPGVGPPQTGGVPAHPTELSIIAWDFNRRSETGAYDFIQIAVWAPAINYYVPIAAVFDIPVPDFWKAMWNGTGPSNPFWYETNAGVSSGHNNSFQVADNELDVWMESSWTYYDCGYKGGNAASANTLMVNLTKSLFINFTSSNPLAGNLSFTLPPMTLEFKEIGEGEEQEVITHPGAWTWTVKETKVPAWVEISIPSWIRGAQLEVVGHLSEQGSNIFTPPAT
jgi:hypothetical protein